MGLSWIGLQIMKMIDNKKGVAAISDAVAPSGSMFIEGGLSVPLSWSYDGKTRRASFTENFF